MYFALLILVFCVTGPVLCDREGWVDLTDPHRYDRTNKRMKPHHIPSTSSSEHRTDCFCDESRLTECERRLDETRSHSLLLQRQTALVLNTAGLLNYKQQDAKDVTRVLRFSLSMEDLGELQEMLQSGDLDMHKLNLVWSKSWSAERDPHLSVWHWLPSLPALPTISLQGFLLSIQVGYMLAVVAMLLLRVPLNTVIIITFILFFFFSAVLRTMRNYQAMEARQTHKQMDPSSMPAECRPPHLRSWWDTFSLAKYSYKSLADMCDQFYEREHAAAELQVTPMEHVAQLLMDLVQGVSARTGDSLREFCDAAFADLMWPLGSIACLVVKIAMFLLPTLMCLGALWFCLWHPTLFLGHQARPGLHQAPQSHAPGPQYHIQNYGNLVVGSQMHPTDLTLPAPVTPFEPPALTRAQSEGALRPSCSCASRPRSLSMPTADLPSLPSSPPDLTSVSEMDEASCTLDPATQVPSTEIQSGQDVTISSAKTSTGQLGPISSAQEKRNIVLDEETSDRGLIIESSSKDLDSMDVDSPLDSSPEMDLSKLTISEESSSNQDSPVLVHSQGYNISEDSSSNQDSPVLVESPECTGSNQESMIVVPRLEHDGSGDAGSVKAEDLTAVDLELRQCFARKEVSPRTPGLLESSDQPSELMDSSDMSLSPMRSELSMFLDSLHVDESLVLTPQTSEESFEIVHSPEQDANKPNP